MKRIYLPLPLAPGAALELPDEVQHRLRHVLRMGVGDRFEVFDGHGALGLAELTDAKARRASVVEMLPTPPPLPRLVLAVALLKRDAWENVLRQATEMGVTEIVPLKTHYAQVGKMNESRALAIMVEAAEQCERVTLPTLAAVSRLEDFVAELKTPCLWAFERMEGEAERRNEAMDTVLIGPEGGFAPEEVAMLQAQPLLVPTSLGPTILRADTAVVAALARVCKW